MAEESKPRVVALRTGVGIVAGNDANEQERVVPYDPVTDQLTPIRH
jgi:hypothetical protein